MKIRLNVLSALILAFPLLFMVSCQKESLLDTVKEDAPGTEQPNMNVDLPCTEETWAVSTHSPGMGAKIYTIDSETGEYTGQEVTVKANGVNVENVLGITRIQQIDGHPKPFFVVSLGANPNLPSQYSNNVWEVDIISGDLIALFKNTNNPITDICWSDFVQPYFCPGCCEVYDEDGAVIAYYDCMQGIGVGMVGMEETPRNNFHHLVYFDLYNNLTPVTIQVDGLPVAEEVQGMTWIRDVSSGCVIPDPYGSVSTQPQTAALDYFDTNGNYIPGDVVLMVATWNPNTQENRFYNISFDVDMPSQTLTAEASLDGNTPVLPAQTFATHFSLGWMSDEGNCGSSVMQTGGNVFQQPFFENYSDAVDFCIMFGPIFGSSQAAPVPVPRELADYVSIPYAIW
ncbi:MAG: hypothetical protein GYB31_01115 [Bacteroidetes bacterium]|nr:hypothetical protein [Bacteroidota bacterium]